MFFRRSRCIFVYPLKMLFHGNASRLIAILFPDWQNSDNIVALEKKTVSKLRMRAMCYFLNEMQKIKSRKNKILRRRLSIY